MNFGVNKPKIFDVQTTSFAEILLVILFFLLIFNFFGAQQVTVLNKQIEKLTKENLKLTNENLKLNVLIAKKQKRIVALEKEVATWKKKFVLVNKENVLLKDEIKKIKLELAKTQEVLNEYQDKYGKLDGDDVVNYCRIGKNDIFPVLNIIATNKKFIITPLWDQKRDGKYINIIPGLNRINKKLTINHKTFKKYFTPTYRWGEKPENNCRFKVRLKIDKSIKKASVFDYVSNEVGRHFYKIRVK